MTIRSASSDDMGMPPVQVFRLGGMGANDADAIGRVIRPVFNGPGDYLIELTVQDNAGFRASTTRTLHVVRRSPVLTNLLLPATLEVGQESIAYVQLRDAGAAQDVQVTLGSSGPEGFIVSTAGSGLTDACGIAQVRVTPQSVDPIDVRVEVLGYTTCDPVTGACVSTSVEQNPGGRPAAPRDTSGPNLEILDPGPEDVAFDSCRPLTVRFSVSDDGVGVDLSTVAVVLDGQFFAGGSACVDGMCTVVIDTAALGTGVHHLDIDAKDLLGNPSTVGRDYRVESSIASILCRVGAGVCANVAPDGITTALVAHLAAAQGREVARNLKAASNDLAAFSLFVSSQRGRHMPDACADALLEDAAWIVGVRWGMDPVQMPWSP
ncbi:MAG: hypothetical protein WCC48_12045 [Anaeromyxobacteraceae bacterium]